MPPIIYKTVSQSAKACDIARELWSEKTGLSLLPGRHKRRNDRPNRNPLGNADIGFDEQRIKPLTLKDIFPGANEEEEPVLSRHRYTKTTQGFPRKRERVQKRKAAHAARRVTRANS